MTDWAKMRICTMMVCRKVESSIWRANRANLERNLGYFSTMRELELSML